MENRELQLKKTYNAIMESEEPFLDTAVGSISILSYNGGGSYNCMLMSDSAGEVETMNFSIRELRNFELGNC